MAHMLPRRRDYNDAFLQRRRPTDAASRAIVLICLMRKSVVVTLRVRGAMRAVCAQNRRRVTITYAHQITLI